MRIYKYKKTSSGKWKRYGYVNAKAYNYSLLHQVLTQDQAHQQGQVEASRLRARRLRPRGHLVERV